MEEKTLQKENIMGTLPVKKLVFVTVWPMVISMFIQSCYGIVDSMFVAKFSPDAFIALSLIFPVQILVISLNVGIGVGINALLARRLGEQRYEEANRVAAHGYVLYLLLGVLYALFGIFFARGFMELFSDDAQVIAYGVSYLRIILILGFGVCLQFAGERMMQATGNPIWNMYIQASGALINVILDPILIFGLFGFPEMGVAGAALATVIGQWTGALIGIYLVKKKVRQIHVTLRHFKFDMEIIRPILRVGVPAMLVQSLATVMSLSLNKIFSMYSEDYVAVLGAYFRIQNFVYLVVYSLGNVVIPVVSYNFGARDRTRVEETIHLCMIIALVSVCAGGGLLFLIPGKLLSMFSLTETSMAVGIPAMRIVSVAFVGGGVSLIFSYAFQALNCNRYSLLISLLRQMIVLLPLAIVLLAVQPIYTWLAFPITEFSCMILAGILFKSAHKKQIATLGEAI